MLIGRAGDVASPAPEKLLSNQEIMNSSQPEMTRRDLVKRAAVLAATLLAALPMGCAKKLSETKRTIGPKNYDPTQHRWIMVLDVDRCIGCGYCVDACKTENEVPEGPYFRTWVERYTITQAEPGSGRLFGETHVDSPNGGKGGFPPSAVPPESVVKAFFVPKLCNLCEHSPCAQACPVGATFEAPDGAVLVDPDYCVGCGFCVQACPYGCRFINPRTHIAEKCTLCYHRITNGLNPACVEACPGGARLFGDLRDPDWFLAIEPFLHNRPVHVLKPHLGTEPRVLYAGLDREVR